MPVRTYERKVFGVPHSLNVSGYSLDKDEDMEKLNKSLVFLDLSTGLHNRNITRDPICGLGDLSAELDPLQGHGLKRLTKPSISGTTNVRDPILLKGDLGGEYNCLYTTKDLSCKKTKDRNIITLEGNLEQELDPIRPHGGLPRSSIKPEAVRNPITGSGDFGLKEWDPIYKHKGKHVLKRPLQVKRDPLTHNVPMVNMGEAEPKPLFKHFDKNKDNDVLSYDDSTKDLRSKDETTVSGIRHYEHQTNKNPITYQEKPGCPEDEPHRSGTRHFNDKIRNDDILRHHGLTDDLDEIKIKKEQAKLQEKFRIHDDPIRHYGLSDDLKSMVVKQQQAQVDAQFRDSKSKLVNNKNR